MAIISSILLWLGVALQLALLVLLFRSGLAAKVVLFTTLLFFYPIRSILLFALFHHISSPDYANLFSGLSLLDLLLQIAVAIELSLSLLRAQLKKQFFRAMMVPGSFIIAAAFTFALTLLLPARSPAPADRGVLYTGALFAQLFLWSLGVKLHPWRRFVLAGLATLGVSGVLSQSSKSIAAFHRNAHSFLAWSYFDAGVYLLILLFWLSCAISAGPVPDMYAEATDAAPLSGPGISRQITRA